MKLAAVILNYNDGDETIEAVRRISEYETLEAVIVVDNASTDGSREKLKAWLREMNHKLAREERDEEEETEQFHRYMLVSSDRNGGYGYGNNLGVQYAYEVAGAEYVLIANPDASFSEDCLKQMLACFEEEDKAAVVSAVLREKDGSLNYGLSAWPLRSFAGELLNSGPLSRRIFRDRLRYPASFFQGKGALEVDVVHGAFLMVDAGRFLTCGGYDENIFLYGEENVLAFKMREHGWKTILLTGASYGHEGSSTISREHDPVARQRMRQASERYYYRQYLGIGRIRQLLAVLFQKLVLLETGLFLRDGKK